MVTYNLHEAIEMHDLNLEILSHILADPTVSPDGTAAWIHLFDSDSGAVYLKITDRILVTHQQAPNDGQTLYLIADLYRRLDNSEQAKIYLNAPTVRLIFNLNNG